MVKSKSRFTRSLCKKLIICVLVVAFALGTMVQAYASDRHMLLHEMDIPAARAFHVYVAVDGRTIPVVATWGFSVQNVLDRAGVTVGPDDNLSHFTHRPVGPNEVIRIQRRVREIHVVAQAIPYAVEAVYTSILSYGQRVFLSPGTPGRRERRYDRLIVDGVVVESIPLGETAVIEPVAGRALVGRPGLRVSPLDFGWERCEDGRPINYVRRLTDQRATAYSDNVGYITATGQRVAVGLVAVNPRYIPYGTLMYITTPCRTFVYGYAIAADTGGDLLRGRIDVDLFFSSHIETVHHGRRLVDIYILRLPS